MASDILIRLIQSASDLELEGLSWICRTSQKHLAS